MTDGNNDEQLLNYVRPFFYYLMQFRNLSRKNDLYLPIKKVCVEMIKNYFLRYTNNQVSQNGAFAIIVAKKDKLWKLKIRLCQ